MAESLPLLGRTRVVLEHPFFPENVGSIARAMRNMGLGRLDLVGGVAPTHPNAYKLAVEAGFILEGARVHESLEAAFGGATLVIGTTAHPFRELRPLTPREAGALARSHDGEVALVFGNEKNGLSLDALRLCHEVVRIPCPVPDASLNLSQAATILCYEWLSAALEGGPPDPLVGWTAIAGPEELDALASHLEDALETAGLFKAHHADKKMATLRRMLGRLRLDAEELSLLRGVARRLSWYFEQQPRPSADERGN